MMGKMMNKLKGVVKTKNYQSFLQYVFFVFISFLFWCFLSLNEVAHHDVSLVLKVENVPENVTFIDAVPSVIAVTARVSGAELFKYYLSGKKNLAIDYKTYSNEEAGTFQVSKQQLSKLVQQVLGSNFSVVDIDPPVLNLKLTSLPGKKVPVRVDLDVVTDLQYAVCGTVTYSCDSVMVYSDKKTLSSINEVFTYHVRETGLKDSLKREIAIAPVKNAKLVPDHIQVTVPIQPLISKRKKVTVSVRNVPDGVRVIVFPSIVEVSCLVPKNRLNDRNDNITAVVDYNSIDHTSKNNRVPVIVGESPAMYKNVKILTDSVEYLIENQE